MSENLKRGSDNMTTIGQRIKNFRKNAGLSQSDLAGRIGVTSQTVSKWECDVGLPDVVQIIPLAEVLDVSCDAILGADANMEKNIKEAYDAVEEKWKDGIDNQSPDRTDMHRTFDYFLAARELFRRYPTNFEVAMYGAKRGGWLLGRIARGLPEIEGFDTKSVMRDVERMCRTIINYDDDIKAKLEAKSRLAIAYHSVREFDKEEEELKGLPEESYWHAKYASSVNFPGGNERIECAKSGFAGACDEFLFWLRAIADAYSAAAKRTEAIEACRNLISFCKEFTDFCDVRELLYLEGIGYILIAQNEIRNGDYGAALDAIESMTDTNLSYLDACKNAKSGATPATIYYDAVTDAAWWDNIDYVADFVKRQLMWAVSDFDDKAGNPVVTSERYKACVRRAEAAAE